MKKPFQVKMEVKDTLELSEIWVQATTLDIGVKIMDHLSAFGEETLQQLPIKQADTIVLLDKKEIIYAEVFQKELTIYTSTSELKTKMALTHLFEELSKKQFMQISKSALVNLAEIQKLELSFSGNLTAILSNGMKVQVARRYVKELKQKLGI